MSEALHLPLRGVRIVRVSTVPFFIVTQLKRQIEALVAGGAQVTVLCSDGAELGLLRQMSGVECVTIPFVRSISPMRDLHALFLLWRFFRKQRIDIVHSTTPKAGLLTAMAARMAGVPLRLHTFTGQPWVNMRGLKRWIIKASDKLIGRLNTHCYADGLCQRRFLIDQGLLAESDISVIASGSLAGVDIARFDPARFAPEQRRALRRSLGIPEGAEVLLFLGRITTDKGVRELLYAFSRLKSAGSKAHLLFVGPFDSESGAGGCVRPQEIEAVLDSHQVGYADDPERYIAIADLLCLPSYREGFGTVVIEAAAMGVPAVGTDIYGLRDAIIDGTTGLLVKPRDADSLYAGLATLLTDSPLRAGMGETAAQRVKELFSAEKVNAALVSEYLRHLKLHGMR